MKHLEPWVHAAYGLIMRRVPGMITCREIEAFLEDHLEGRLKGRERLVFGFHLATCPKCRSYVRAYHRAVETGRQVFKENPKAAREEVPEELVQAILAARRTDRKPTCC